MVTRRLGFECQLGDNTGSFGTPAWRNNKWAQDITINEEPGGVIDATDRFAQSETSLATRFKLSYDVTGIWQGNTSQTLFRTRFLSGAVFDVSVLDRVSTASVASSGLGHRGEMLVKKFALEFPLEGEQKLSITLVPHGQYATGQGVVVYTDATTALGTADAAGTRKYGKDASINNGSNSPLAGIRDWRLNLEWITANSSDRSLSFDTEVPTIMSYTVEAEFAWAADDSTLAAIRTAYNAHSALASYSFLDGAYATSGSWGLQSDMEVTKFTKTAMIKDLQIYSVTFKPRSNVSGTLPTFITI